MSVKRFQLPGAPPKTPAWLVPTRVVLPSGRKATRAVAPVWLTGPRSCQTGFAARAFSASCLAMNARLARRFSASIACQSYPGAARWRLSSHRNRRSRFEPSSSSSPNAGGRPWVSHRPWTTEGREGSGVGFAGREWRALPAVKASRSEAAAKTDFLNRETT